MSVSPSGTFSRRPCRRDLDSARPGRRPQAPGARPRGLALTLAPVARAARSRRRKNSISLAETPSPPPLAHCVPNIFYQRTLQRASKLETPRPSPTREHATEPSHTLAPAHENIRSIEHGYGHQEHLTFSGSAALLLSIVHPSSERAGTLARAECGEQVAGRGFCRAESLPWLPT